MRALLLLSFCLGVLGCAVFDIRRERPDYIIIGAGGGGAVLANRLSKDCRNKVLVIEQGQNCSTCDASLGAQFFSNSPFQASLLPQTQQFLALLRQPTEVQYEAIGGSTKIFGCVNTRASRQFLAAHYPAGFQYNDLLPYFKQNEDHFCFYLPAHVTNITASDCLAYHGRYGDMAISPQAFGVVSQQMQALVNFVGSSPFGPYNSDYNGASRAGIAYEQDFRAMADKDDLYSARSRVDAQIGFLPKCVMARPNLVFMLNTRVTRLTTTEDDDEEREAPLINRVEYLFNGTTAGAVTANKRVILAAGVIRTPQLLQLSGIGPRALLNSFGIPVRAANPAVGANLHAHQATIMAFQTINPVRHNASFSSNNAAEWFFSSGLSPGLSADIQVELLEGIYTASVEASADSLPIPVLQRLLTGQSSLPFIAAEIESLNPAARGFVQINSREATKTPAFDLGWNISKILTSGDLTKMLTAIAIVRNVFLGNNSFAKQNILKEIWPGDYFQQQLILSGITPGSTNIPPFGLDFNTYADVLFLEYYMTHFYHIIGSCTLGDCTDLTGAVRGVRGLSVCDNSLLPGVDGNPTTTLFAVCSKIADLILAADTE